ncbi:antiviral reverse transcriptase Drt4 [Pseudoalteromonas ruthenica]|uniref:Reverse transcriptase domain-containing protein n=1 Tax=Pseudoalteromonas ruthenica TaxID=151081 RepID=A0A0F4PTV1_9GAMM|nr:antiviral reverse transcriptase Drt4 [Pseudoalteromonas ruthenica]KJY96668.1 hypothetical protein TW76_11445 [Pseudoalteromonas ruthenica]KJY98539.1 hypothetical protein TW72_12460 [Pseudoalteromonas ruthenica]TMO91261.1 hypothetical protein CWC13_15625 [Pseudoalteromonas ruthenica]TMO97948.1 hypothetical protein CWC07_12815 [Pseudoalteromonas ruthenica]TMP06841.1 hypothetical protein CWC09_10750 [Pseudoalteromonas ruthenica]
MAPPLNDEELQRRVYEALTRFNYFPNQREGLPELPPCVCTRQFTPEIAEALDSLQTRKGGYDLVEFHSTRYNNLPRTLGLIHPRAYASLSKCIHDNWFSIRPSFSNTKSIIKPELHDDGRLMIMNYEEPTQKIYRDHEISFGKRFRVTTDISNCFNSIYTHAIPWALIGIIPAKAGQDDGNFWVNKLDKCQRLVKRNETLGVPIGPATSSISVEIILNKVDHELSKTGYDFIRYVDDYTCYCDTEEQAQHFIKDLKEHLKQFKLTLNLRKTTVENLPLSHEDTWLLDLKAALPHRLNNGDDDEPELSPAETLTFINKAIEINKETPDGSVLKYAFSIILSHLESVATNQALNSLVNLSWYYPSLIPLISLYLDKFYTQLQAQELPYKTQLTGLLVENAKNKRSDGISWLLFILFKYDVELTHENVQYVIESGDCVAITILLELGQFTDQIITFVQDNILDKDIFTLDNYWLLLYQLNRRDLIQDPYKDGVFKKLREFRVNFIPGESITNAENVCEEVIAKIKRDFMATVFGNIKDTNIT